MKKLVFLSLSLLICAASCRKAETPAPQPEQIQTGVNPSISERRLNDKMNGQDDFAIDAYYHAPSTGIVIIKQPGDRNTGPQNIHRK